ncbi:T9SS type A sorting domain-containing protein [Hymenobacter rigui]|uniref:T9SS C-terminal target domain-containing protein n=1 Tax=Hymenobacter rigui TaxID=334424 RepID=A0A3R9MLA5_9BACT|nr:T9SS type A sorting domain-containing protein [Hymenobacter rigui]RSK48465.1 T9SS C-terminal target domain-containing protein [Hymenobacter rigui]
MKHVFALMLSLVLGVAGTAAGQNWCPFRPAGDVHAFRLAATDTVLTLRLDSAGVQGPDSLYFFNRIMRRTMTRAWYKSRNNQFGVRLRYQATQQMYQLEWNAEAGQPAASVPLPVRLKTGSSLTIGSGPTAVTVQATSRTVRMLEGTADSVLTLTLSTGAVYEISKNFGLLTAPGPGGRSLTLARRPGPAGQSYYNPLTLLTLQPGDELGFETRPIMSSGIDCYHEWILRRVVSRQQTADSLVYVFQQQTTRMQSNAPSCYPVPSTVTSPVQRVRLAASLRTGRWGGSGTLLSNNLVPRRAELLAYEYAMLPNQLLMGFPVLAPSAVSPPAGIGCTGASLLQQQALYWESGDNSFHPGLDSRAWGQALNAGLGLTAQYETTLTYYQRTSNGSSITCGSRTAFSALLPNRNAVATALKLYPNPAAAEAVLELSEASAAGTQVTLLDVTGRTRLTQQVPARATRLVIPLTDLAAGLYVVRIKQPGHAPVLLRLQH